MFKGNDSTLIQNSSLRLSLGAMYSTPVEPMRTEALEPPRKLRRGTLAEKFIIRYHNQNPRYINKISQLNTLELTNKYWAKKPSPLTSEAFRENMDLLEVLHSHTPEQGFEFLDLLKPIEIIEPSCCDDLPSRVYLCKLSPRVYCSDSGEATRADRLQTPSDRHDNIHFHTNSCNKTVNTVHSIQIRLFIIRSINT
ncbi:hypothetical protein JTB14_034745 [Gonioctena quinquepunctata]|nr:hypothetical protein JTB14_034745 [Gonioctena quinquepunctata]